MGISLFTASKRWVVALQRAAHLLVNVGGPRMLPYRCELWEPPCKPDEWRALVTAWHDILGPFDGFALYRRRQQARSGNTLLLTQQGVALALVKFSGDSGIGLEVEQAALAAVGRFQPRTFRAPRPLGTGRVGQFRWTAQEAVFTTPHKPVFRPPAELFDEVAACLLDMLPCTTGSGFPDTGLASTPLSRVPGSNLVTTHGDLTPWNLRRDRSGQIWLYDWEDVGLAPKDSDKAYFWVTSRALGEAEMPADLGAAAVEHCRAIVHQRTGGNPEDAPLLILMLKALGEADARRSTPTPPGVTSRH